MPKLCRQSLSNAIQKAIEVFTACSLRSHEPSLDRVTDCIGAELELGVSKLPGAPAHEDIDAYLLALLAAKTIAGCDADEHRMGAIRCLCAAAEELMETASRRSAASIPRTLPVQ